MWRLRVTIAERMGAMGLIGREREVGEIREFLHGLDGGAAGLVVAGEPGIGKTALWEKGVEEARGMSRVLVHRSVEAEAHLSFVGLSDLLMPVFDEVSPSLSAPRRDALEVALLLATPGEVAPDPRAVGLALLDVIRVLAEDGAVVLALDDLQWLDASSAAVLQIALRRLREEPVGLLATLRKAAGVEAGFKPQHAFREERYERMWLEPLSLAALYRLLKERLGLELTRPELARVRDASGGNPFFALELGRDFVATSSGRVAGGGLWFRRACASSSAGALRGCLRAPWIFSFAPRRSPDRLLSCLRQLVPSGIPCSKRWTRRCARGSWPSTVHACVSPIPCLPRFVTSRRCRRSAAQSIGRWQES